MQCVYCVVWDAVINTLWGSYSHQTVLLLLFDYYYFIIIVSIINTISVIIVVTVSITIIIYIRYYNWMKRWRSIDEEFIVSSQ